MNFNLSSYYFLRLSKTLLVAAAAFYFTLVVFNNITDFNSNYQFVRHVLQMDSTFPGNSGMWRAINRPAIHTAFYIGIIAWEAITMLLCWTATIRLAIALKQTVAAFRRASMIAVSALTLGMLLWFVAFLSIGGEWFLMWQSHSWNGQDASFRIFAVLGIILLYIAQPETAA